MMARNPERINTVLVLLSVYWNKNPDLRLGQILGNAATGDAYHYEDDDLIAWFRKELGWDE